MLAWMKNQVLVRNLRRGTMAVNAVRITIARAAIAIVKIDVPIARQDQAMAIHYQKKATIREKRTVDI